MENGKQQRGIWGEEVGTEDFKKTRRANRWQEGSVLIFLQIAMA
jgi:hypothetical protein